MSKYWSMVKWTTGLLLADFAQNRTFSQKNILTPVHIWLVEVIILPFSCLAGTHLSQHFVGRKWNVFPTFPNVNLNPAEIWTSVELKLKCGNLSVITCLKDEYKIERLYSLIHWNKPSVCLITSFALLELTRGSTLRPNSLIYCIELFYSIFLNCTICIKV